MLSIRSVLDDTRPIDRRKAKIVATIGPSTQSEPVLKELVRAGVNVFRLNFSHSVPAAHLEVLQHIRKLSRDEKRFTAVLQDLPGPKIRISTVEQDVVRLTDNQTILLKPADGSRSNLDTIYVQTIDPTKIVKPNQRILLADGLLVLESVSASSKGIECRVLKGGELRSKVGIAFPDSHIDLPAVTERDLESLKWGVENEVDYVALSFVNSSQDVLRARQVIKQLNGDVKVIAKIERRQALEQIEEILGVADGIMVARGDLGLELQLEKLPILQRLLIEHANYHGIPVIVATQMLQSMVTSLTPTRAEVADVSLAVLNGADALMLSAETAIGQNPVEVVRQLDRIIREAERRPAGSRDLRANPRGTDSLSVPDAVVFAACGAATKINASAIIACTETGNSARLCSKYRPQQPLFGVSSSEKTLRRMCLYWGVTPIPTAPTGTHQDELQTALREVQTRQNLPNGSWAVVTGGASVRTPGATSILEIREMSLL